MNSMSQYPKFTVIIPQKDRAEYLIHTLRTCMIQDYPNFEIIVGDDCSEDNTVEIVRDLQKKDPRIKLIAHDHHVGMRMNFELALAEVKEGYVMALGGDDGLVPGCIWRMYEIIAETSCQLLTWRTPSFNYPQTPGDSCMLSVCRESFKGYKVVRSEDFLNSISKSLYYLVDECPMFYIKGVASIDLVNRVKSRTPDHSFYYCPTPDGFSGVVLAGEIETYIYTNEPLSIGGASPKSQGLNYKRNDEQSKKESEQFFIDSARQTMHSSLASQPYSPLITLMTADYLLTARDLPGWPGRFTMFSYENLLISTFKMLETDPFTNEVLVRELKILKEIAIQHNLEELFNTLLKNTKRRVIHKESINCPRITKNVFVFNASDLGITNIYEAALASKFAFSLCNTFCFKYILKTSVQIFKFLFSLMRRKVEYLPKV